MRDAFRGHYPPTDAEFSVMWAAGSIVLDTNALLNLYRYTEATRTEFLSVLSKLTDRLWIPAQVGKEFQSRRMGVIDEQRAAFDHIRNDLEGTQKTLEGSISRFKRHSSLDVGKIAKTYGAAVQKILAELKSQQVEHETLFGRGYPEDPIWERITELLGGRVGSPFSLAELQEIYSDGAKRYADEIPPGYKDSSKGEPGKYGDLIIWKEILARGAVRSDSVIFVTDDGKEDWWRIFNGQKLGPRPELIEEYFAASGMRIHFYTPEQFLRHAQERVQVRVSKRSLGEVQQVSTDAGSRLRAVAELRLRQLQQQRDHYEHRVERQQDPTPRAHTELRHRLLEGRAEAQSELAQFEKVLDEVRHRALVSKPGDSTEASARASHAEGLEDLMKSTRARLADIERRLLQFDRPRRLTNDYREKLRAIDREIGDIADAIAEIEGNDDDDASGARAFQWEESSGSAIK